ncbi:CHAT domain-containing protein [Pedobacter arcticus]|uniref:CHAT domain-containing protein n=1 Tax=Pedobacter arcticus TaxID=752140 RepID=UPI000304D4B6|nr:CHAT domain-containing tetratricopeptide repeat protein [Pedobacter arcticus]
MARISIFIFCIFITFSTTFGQNTDAVFQKKLSVFKTEDSLAKWIDSRVDFALIQPSERLLFLMQTNKLAWRAPKTQQENESWLFLLVNQGYYQLQNGDILASITCYENAYEFSEKHPTGLDIEEYILKPLSNNYTRLGDYERAIYIQKRSLNLALKQNKLDLATSAYCNLSTSYRSKNDLRNAEQSALAGLKIADKKSAIYGLLLSNMADISNENKDYAKAEGFVSTAIRHLKLQKLNSSTAYWLLSAYTLAGDIQLNQENLESAKNFYKNAQKLIYSLLGGGRKRELTYLINQLGSVYLVQKDYQQALSQYNQALIYLLPEFKLLKPNDLPDERTLFGENKLQAALMGKAEVLARLGDKKQSLQASILAFAVAEELRKEYTYDVSKERLQAESKALAELVIEKSYELWVKTKDAVYANHILMFSEQTKSRILFDELNASQSSDSKRKKNPLQQQKIKIQQLLSYYQKQKQSNSNTVILKKIADLEFQLSSLQKQLNQKNPSLTLKATQILQKIPVEKQAIIFFCGDRNSYMIIANHHKVSQVIKLGTTKQLSASVGHYLEKYFYNGPAEMINNPQAFYNASNNIQKLLFSQVNINNQKVLLIKDGILNFLPFESLITESGVAKNVAQWPFLIKKVEISYGFSLSSIPSVKRSKTAYRYQFTGIFLSRTGSSKNEIPAVVAEYDALKRFIKGDFFKNEDATVDNFKQAINHSDILHLSSHSYLTDSLKEPVLELYHDRFYLLELASQQKVPELVVLSACQTADGAYLSGEGVLSFSRGFIAAGSKGVISSLWNVNDQSGADLMVNYYRTLLQRKTTAGTLAKTKLQWLKQKHKNQMVLLPYYWDSLIYTGEDFGVTIEEPGHFLVYSGVSLSILLGIVVFFYRKKRLNISPTRG